METFISRISLTTIDGHHLFKPEEILRLKACSNYTWIFFTNKTKIFSAKVLKEYVRILEPHGFIRTHHTHLVNPLHIHRITRDGHIIMSDKSVAGISRRKKATVLKQLTKASLIF